MGRSLSAGESFSLYYRVILHAGDVKAGRIAEAYDRYAVASRWPDRIGLRR